MRSSTAVAPAPQRPSSTSRAVAESMADLGEKTGFDGTDAGSGKPSAQSKQPNFLVRGWRAYENALSSFVGIVARGYGRLGAFTATRPYTVLSVSLILGVLCCLGFLRFKLETDADVLWVPQGGKARDDKEYVRAWYPRSREGASFYARLAPSQYAAFGGDNAVQMPVTWEMFQLHNKVMALTVKDDNGKDVTYMDLCYRNKDGSCNLANGYLWYWYKDFNYYINDIQGSTTSPTAGNVTRFKDDVSSTRYPDGRPVSLLSVFGGTTFSFNPFQLVSAQVIASDYTLDDAVTKETAKRWHLAFIDLMEAELPKQQYMTYTFITGSTVGEELGKSINNDMFLVVISFLVFIAVAVIFMSSFSYKTRTTLALAGVFVVALGIVAGWGWGMIFGMPFTPLQQLSPFILLGMGIDVMFILVKGYDVIIQREPWLTLPEAFSKLMSTSGLSVQVTLLASCVAFALGAVDELLSVKWFSAYATLNTLMIMLLMMTAFVAFMVLVERRIRKGRYDFLCCFTSKHYQAPPPPPLPTQEDPRTPHGAAPKLDDVSRTHTDNVVSGVSGHVVHDDDVKDESWVKKFFRKYYAPLLTKWYIKVIVIAIFTAYAAASWYGIYQIKYGQPLSDLAPDGSYLQNYDKIQQSTYATQVGEPVGLYFRNIDFSDPAVQYKMFRAWDMGLQSSYVNASNTAFLGAWLVDFTLWAQRRNLTVAQPTNNCYNPLVGKVTGQLAGVITPSPITGCVPQAQFYNYLTQWLNGTTNNNVIMRSGIIITSSLPLMLTPSALDDKFNQHMIKAIRDVDSQINDELFAKVNSAAGTNLVFIYGGSFVFAEGDSILGEQALIYFILALVGVGVVTLFMLVNPIASIFMMISVGLVVLFLFGELWILNIRFNQVSIINMIMATGLSVDYSVYFAQKFMTTKDDGTGNGRMVRALADTGFAVFLGGFTALLGAIPIAFSKSVIIRTFFKLIFGTIIFSLLVGLMLMPVIFSLIPPPPVRSALMDGGHNRSHEKQADKANGVPDRRHSDSSGSDDTVGVVVDSKPELKV